MIAYLSGAMEYAQNEGADLRLVMKDWLKEHLSHEVSNPVIESNKLVVHYDAKDNQDWGKTDLGRFKEFFRLLIQQDLRAVLGESDYLIVLWDKGVLKGRVTHSEVTMGYWVDKPIFLVNTLSEEDLSAWISSCFTETFASFDELKADLLKRYKKTK